MINQHATDADLETIEVSSSQIKEIGHSAKNQALYIRFNNGSIYRYSPYTSVQWMEFKTAPSIGKYFYSSIKTNAGLPGIKIHNG